MLPNTDQIGFILREMGLLTCADISRILLEQSRVQQSFGEVARRWGLVSEDQVCEAWARQLVGEFRHVDLDRFEWNAHALQQLPAVVARQFRALPLRCWGDHLIVALAALPLDGRVLTDIAAASGHSHVYCCYCSSEQLSRYLELHYPLVSSSVLSSPAT